jgi:chromosome segregation ATPase
VKTETTQPIEALEKKVEDLALEVEELEGQLRDATSQIARAQQRFAELDERRTSLAPHAFRGDSKAQLEVEALEAEHDELKRNTRVTRAAAPELAKMLEDAKERLKDARREAHKARAGEVRQEMEALDPERDKLAGQLLEVLEKQSSLRGEYIQALNLYDQDAANSLATDVGGGPHARWLKQVFKRWL